MVIPVSGHTWRRPVLALIQSLSALGGACLLRATPVLAQQLTISTPVQIPLHWTTIRSGYATSPQKLGIYVALGGGSGPQLFEFDTGGSGFYPAYSASVPWWGSNVQPQAIYNQFSQTYDSNTTYEGHVVTTTVSIYASPSDSTPLITATDVLVGKTDRILDPNGNPVWSPTSDTQTAPPLQGAFWGDFGMAPKQGQQGQNSAGAPGGATLDSLISQLLFSGAATAGYRVHASSSNPWVQIGLGPDDLLTGATTFALKSAHSSSATQVPYYEAKVIRGSLEVSHGSTTFANQDTGIIFDTGAFTTIHQASGGTTTVPPTALDHHLLVNDSDVKPGSQVVISSQPVGLSSWTPFLSFEAGVVVDQDLVAVQDGNSYYLNTGMLPFLSNDIIYNLASAQLTLVPQPQPVPEPLSLSGLALAASLSRRLRRRSTAARMSRWHDQGAGRSSGLRHPCDPPGADPGG